MKLILNRRLLQDSEIKSIFRYLSVQLELPEEDLVVNRLGQLDFIKSMKRSSLFSRDLEIEPRDYAVNLRAAAFDLFREIETDIIGRSIGSLIRK